MAQDRMLRASMRSSEKVNSWPIPVRYFWTQLWGYCDDHGRGRYDPRLIVADTFPIDDEVTATTVSRWMQALELAGVISVYEVAGKAYFECVNWDEHQDLPYLRKTEVPDRFGDVPEPAKRSKKILESSGKVPPKGRGREGEIEGGKADAEPPLFCSAHPNGSAQRCGRCADARRLHEQWERVTKPAARPTIVGIVTDPDCDIHPGRPKRGCDRCAEEGVA
jgi:hypothetical protein